MTSRERVRKAINHEVSDKVPLDLGGTVVSSISASSYAKLREALGLPAKRVQITEPYQMLGEIEPEVREILEIDTIGLQLPTTMFGFRNENWKEWKLFDGTEVLIPGKFVTTADEKGDLLLYPEGDTSAPPSGRMPEGGYYFDVIVRQPPIDEDHLDPREWVKDQYLPYSEEELRYLEEKANELFHNTSLSIIGNFGGGGFGDIAWVPAPNVKYPQGIRDPKEWYIAHVTHPEYIRGIFELQCEISMKNLLLYQQAVGDNIDIVFISGTDFGMQNGPFISPDMYRELYKPFHKRINDWVHKNTNWKTFFHTCGSISAFLNDFAEAGVDIINPVQCSAAEMSPSYLKGKYGDKFVFWGGGVDTQKTLPFGTPQEVKREVQKRIEIFGKGGGFVFSAIHNIQRGTPIENLVALFEAVKEFRTLRG